MLVLSRKEGETLIIGDDIRVTIAQVRGNRVKVGVDAPSSVQIKRGELAQRPELPPQKNAVIESSIAEVAA